MKELFRINGALYMIEIKRPLLSKYCSLENNLSIIFKKNNILKKKENNIFECVYFQFLDAKSFNFSVK